MGKGGGSFECLRGKNKNFFLKSEFRKDVRSHYQYLLEKNYMQGIAKILKGPIRRCDVS